MTYDIATLLLNNDGVADEAKRILGFVAGKFGATLNFIEIPLNGDESSSQYCFSDEVARKIGSAHALLFATGSLKGKPSVISEKSMEKLASDLKLYARICSIKQYQSLASLYAIKGEASDCNIDYSIVSDIPNLKNSDEHGFRSNSAFGREAYDVERYSELEIERVARIAYEYADPRRRRLTLADMADKKTSSLLWRKIVTDINEDYPYVNVDTLTIRQAAKELVINASQFDTLVTSSDLSESLYGIALATAGVESLISSAYVGDTTFGMFGVYDTADIASNCIVPDTEDDFMRLKAASSESLYLLGVLRSAAMLLRHSLDMSDAAAAIENATSKLLNDGNYDIINATAARTAADIISNLQ